MARFTVRRQAFGSYDAVALTDTITGAQAVAAAHGATLLTYRVPRKKDCFELLDGFGSPEEMLSGTGGKSVLMAPWSNRLRDGTYTWEGRTHQAVVNHAASHSAIHGLLRHVEFSIAQENERAEAAEVVFRTAALRPGAFEGYPFAVDVTVTFTLAEGGLALTIGAVNVGEKDAPFGCGWHPYLRLPGRRIDRLALTVPARSVVAVDERCLPLPGEAAHRPLEEEPTLDFRTGAEIRGREIDNAFADLQPGEDGRHRTVLADPESGSRVTVWQERGLMHVYTGTRESLALEPVEFMTDAFNRPECAEAVRLPAGASRAFRCGVAPELA